MCMHKWAKRHCAKRCVQVYVYIWLQCLYWLHLYYYLFITTISFITEPSSIKPKELCYLRDFKKHVKKPHYDHKLLYGICLLFLGCSSACEKNQKISSTCFASVSMCIYKWAKRRANLITMHMHADACAYIDFISIVTHLPPPSHLSRSRLPSQNCFCNNSADPQFWKKVRNDKTTFLNKISASFST